MPGRLRRNRGEAVQPQSHAHTISPWLVGFRHGRQLLSGLGSPPYIQEQNLLANTTLPGDSSLSVTANYNTLSQ